MHIVLVHHVGWPSLCYMILVIRCSLFDTGFLSFSLTGPLMLASAFSAIRFQLLVEQSDSL